MLEQLKDKLQTVQNDLSSSIKSLATPISPEAKQEVRTKLGFHRNAHKFKVNLNAGADLLHRYQTQWQEVHEINERNAKLADEVYKAIDLVDSQTKREKNVINEFISQLTSLPQLIESMEAIEKDLIKTKNDFIKVEQLLTKLQDMKEIEEIDKIKIDHKFKLEAYKDQNIANLDAIRVKFAVQYTQRVHEFERQQQSVLKERQQAFQKAFEEELHLYKTQGKIEPKVTNNSDINNVCIEDIDIETEKSDNDALEEFLQE
ncbi:dysbindin-like [Oppia nitens]|uniref:dysbindin-like n=1 Tax=Oppia nitens TaxID=1686743 RepID=UPI0023DB8E64|nr:dysbindin-like [Oppia nitens]